MPALLAVAFLPDCCLCCHGKSSITAITQETTLSILNVCTGMAHAGSSSKWRCQMSAVIGQQA